MSRLKNQLRGPVTLDNSTIEAEVQKVLNTLEATKTLEACEGTQITFQNLSNRLQTWVAAIKTLEPCRDNQAPYNIYRHRVFAQATGTFHSDVEHLDQSKLKNILSTITTVESRSDFRRPEWNETLKLLTQQLDNNTVDTPTTISHTHPIQKYPLTCVNWNNFMANIVSDNKYQTQQNIHLCTTNTDIRQLFDIQLQPYVHPTVSKSYNILCQYFRFVVCNYKCSWGDPATSEDGTWLITYLLECYKIYRNNATGKLAFAWVVPNEFTDISLQILCTIIPAGLDRLSNIDIIDTFTCTEITQSMLENLLTQDQIKIGSIINSHYTTVQPTFGGGGGHQGNITSKDLLMLFNILTNMAKQNSRELCEYTFLDLGTSVHRLTYMYIYIYIYIYI